MNTATQYKTIETENPITFGTYEGWGLDEMFGKDVFKAIKEIESSHRPWRKKVSETYDALLQKRADARRLINRKHYGKERGRKASRVVRVNIS